MVVRRKATVTKTTLASGMLKAASFAVFNPSIAKFNEERVLPRPFDRWDPSAIVKVQGSCERVVQRGGREEGSEP